MEKISCRKTNWLRLIRSFSKFNWNYWFYSSTVIYRLHLKSPKYNPFSLHLKNHFSSHPPTPCWYFFAFFFDLTWTVGSLVFAEDLGCKVLELPEDLGCRVLELAEDLGFRVLELAEDLFFLDGRESIEQYRYIVI